MRVKGREEPDYSFQIPAAGWHNVVVQDGIDFVKDRTTGEDKVSEKGNKSIIVSMLIEGGDDAGKRVSQFCVYNTEFGEQKLADLLLATGLMPKFEEKFPGDVSLWDPNVLQAIQLKLPGNFLQVKLEPTKDGKNTNIISMLPSGKKSKADKKEKAPVRGPEAVTTVPAGGDW